MPHGHKLIAWIEYPGDGKYVASFVSEAAWNMRTPAVRVCTSYDQARS